MILHLKFLEASHFTAFEDEEEEDWEWEAVEDVERWVGGGKSLATQRSPASEGVRR